MPASCSRRTQMICSSVNLDRFIVRLPRVDGLYPFLAEFAGLRSLTLLLMLQGFTGRLNRTSSWLISMLRSSSGFST